MADNKTSDFEFILNKSFDLAVEHQHEYVTLEHLLVACLEQKSLANLLTNIGKQPQLIIDIPAQSSHLSNKPKHKACS